MPKKTFALQAGGPTGVEIEWRGIWKDTRVRVDGAELGVIATKAELEAGRSFLLPTGGVLAVQLTRKFAAVELVVTRDGVALPGSASDPAERVKQAAYMLYFLAALNVVLGVLAEVAGIDFLRSMGVGWASCAEGVVFGILGWRTAKQSQVALYLGIALFAVDTVFVLLGSVQAGQTPPIGGLVARFFFFMPLVKGVPAIRELASKKTAAAASVPAI